MKHLAILSSFILVSIISLGTELESDSSQVYNMALSSEKLSSASAPDLIFLPTPIIQDYNAVVSQVSSFGAVSREEFRTPVQLSLSVERRLNKGDAKRFSVGAGAGALLVISSLEFQDYSNSMKEIISRTYLTIPVYVKYDYLQDRRVQLFATAGVSSEFGLNARIKRETYQSGELTGTINSSEKLNSSQFNFSFGSGINVKVAKHFSLFTEASVAHYFSESRTTIWSNQTLWLNLRTGLNVQF